MHRIRFEGSTLLNSESPGLLVSCEQKAFQVKHWSYAATP